jgi:hypothetical protein
VAAHAGLAVGEQPQDADACRVRDGLGKGGELRVGDGVVRGREHDGRARGG